MQQAFAFCVSELNYIAQQNKYSYEKNDGRV